jgi:hypothetical protein
MANGESGEWTDLGDGFFAIDITPPAPVRDDRAPDIGFVLFAISVESNTDNGGLWNDDPLRLITELKAKEFFRLPEDDAEIQIVTLRINAERPVNPKYTRSTFANYPGSSRVVIVHFKDERGRDAA